ncbi:MULTISPECIES: chemotaxis protein CheW [Methanosarcina]|jgi:purine-binding chemotaxis protein CheW|uniref:Chemotaxis protein CheW n=4 Tax=Methanosarcina mazei TaxID=2209 RepID=A0A0F8RSN4_METMZ|nr:MULTISPECIES: chemotaxis protein CheW [Methanosarcina]AAM30028.1 Chemotaxis protein [Methanosarcina mazei Go1]AKB39948.1 Positive regulator of CheA protein activity (CheW) [Methanosarcina mazei WWM610]AKB70861.1 Positive regulator of CheA protein activity (CheW) [Methanosarcina mazei C16]KKF98794.1 chemotaxis protein CheW [Methanosarcina mazei]KKG05345.1 chemotaxis protein CheW [Methanosarcina mazei]
MSYHSQIVNVDNTIQVIVFSLGEERYGVEISQVKEIILPTQITRIPNVPGFVEGVLNLRGQIATIINLRKRLGKESKKNDENTRIIVIEYNNATIGMMVDSVSEVKYLSSQNIEEIPKFLALRDDSKFLKGVGKLEDGLLTLMDLKELFSEEELKEMRG